MKDLIQQYLAENKHMQLATVHDGQPWICTVYFVADDEFNLYWMSARERQHSVEITNDSKVAVTVVRDTERKQELEHAHELYQSKFGAKDYDLSEIKQHKPTGRAYWVFNPTKISLWDEVNFPDKPKQVYEL
jgi:hypothetical protein